MKIFNRAILSLFVLGICFSDAFAAPASFTPIAPVQDVSAANRVQDFLGSATAAVVYAGVAGKQVHVYSVSIGVGACQGVTIVDFYDGGIHAYQINLGGIALPYSFPTAFTSRVGNTLEVRATCSASVPNGTLSVQADQF